MLNDVWMKIAQFLGNLDGENVGRKSVPIFRDIQTASRYCSTWGF